MKQPQYLRAKLRKSNCCCPAKGQILAISLVTNAAAGVTGEIHYVDAGYNKVGMPDPKNMI